MITANKLAATLRQLLNYSGGWDAPKAHPCGKARDVLAAYDAQQPPTLQEACTVMLEAMQREAATATPGDAAWLTRNMGIIRKMQQ